MIPYTLNENGVTFFYKGRQRVIGADNPNFTGVVDAVTSGETGSLDSILDMRAFIVTASSGNVSICSDDVVRYRGEQVPDYLAQRIITHHNKGYPIEPLCNFAEKLMQNPNIEVRDDLYRWLERGNMPIYPDGDFAAYKLVRNDFTPIHVGPYGQDQSPGQTVSMPRHACDERRDHTCSAGLHFCSYEYLPTFQSWNNNLGQKVILLKINPENVTAIPTDYNLSKGRCCEFFVVSEIEFMNIKEDFGGKLVLNSSVYTTGDVSLNLEVDEDEEVSFHVSSIAPEEVTYQEVVDMIAEYAGNKTAAASQLGISRSKLYKILNNPPVVPDKRLIAEEAVKAFDGNKTRAAAGLGISRSTLSRWLNL